MKKLALLLCALLLALPFAAAEEHVCEPSGLIDMDLNERWDVCSCGEKLNVTAHSWETDEWGDKMCAICGAAQYLWDDGMVELQGYDEQGNCIRQLSWSAEGDVLIDQSTIYQYDGEGNVNYAWYYDGGRLVAESEFALDHEGYEMEVCAIEYYEDGSMSVSEFNEHGDQTLVAYYFDGVLESTLRFDYAYDDNGFVTKMRTFSDDALVEEADYILLMDDEENYVNYVARQTVWYEDDTRVVYINDEFGETVSETHYDAAGNVVKNLTFESEYDEEGNLLRVTTMEDGVLSMVVEYALDEEGWTYRAREILYAADGTATETRYDELGEVIE